MKIAHIIPSYVKVMGGLQVCVHNISERHAKSGNTVVVFTYQSQPDSLQISYEIKKIPPFIFLTKGYPVSKYIVSAYFALLQKKYKFDIWQVDGGYPYGVLLVDFFRKNKIPCVLRCSGDDIQVSEELKYGVRRNRQIDRLIRDNYKKFSAVVAISETVRQEYKSLLVAENKIKLIPNGVDLERVRGFKPNDDIRARHGIPPDSKIILTVGRNHPKKGYHLIPNILNKICDNIPNVFWIVIGKGSKEVDTSALVGRAHGNLICLDEVNNADLGSQPQELPPSALLNYYLQANLFALPSFVETFGIVLVEANAAGLPVVCFNAPGSRDVIINGQNGVLVELGNKAEFAERIQELLRNRILYMKLKNNIDKAVTLYDWDNIAKEYLDLYSTLEAVR